jgi:hypothetical protein
MGYIRKLKTNNELESSTQGNKGKEKMIDHNVTKRGQGDNAVGSIPSIMKIVPVM